MPHLDWSPGALRDLARLHEFLREKSPKVANRAISVIRKSVELLADHPNLGRAAPDLPAAFREWSISFAGGGYVALYHFDGGAVVIIAVRHGRERSW